MLLKLFVNANIMKTQFFHKMKYDLKGQLLLCPTFALVFYMNLTVHAYKFLHNTHDWIVK